jgi:hypothetical protein
MIQVYRFYIPLNQCSYGKKRIQVFTVICGSNFCYRSLIYLQTISLAGLISQRECVLENVSEVSKLLAVYGF